MKTSINYLIIVTFFSIAMAVIESSVVVYLRELYYPEGFTITLNPISLKIINVELAREFATLVMLIAIGWMAGRNATTRFAWFLYAFAIWDIFYYVFLKIFIDWPASIMEWDILFLLPVTWLAPVLAPVISSLTMILLSLVLINSSVKVENFRLKLLPLSLLIAGSVVILVSFTWDYASIIIKNDFHKDFFNIMRNQKFISITSTFIPESFNWIIFITGEIIILAGIYRIFLETRKPSKITSS